MANPPLILPPLQVGVQEVPANIQAVPQAAVPELRSAKSANEFVPH